MLKAQGRFRMACLRILNPWTDCQKIFSHTQQAIYNKLLKAACFTPLFLKADTIFHTPPLPGNAVLDRQPHRRFFISVLPSRSRVVEIIIVLVIAYQEGEEAVLRPHPLQLLSCSFDQPAVAWVGYSISMVAHRITGILILQIGFTQYIRGFQTGELT